MIVDERVSCYIKSLTACNSNFLEELREKALEDKVPIIKRETESLLKTLLLLKKPKKILEVGTAVAYSSLVMAEVLEGKIFRGKKEYRWFKLYKYNTFDRRRRLKGS